MTKKLLLVAAWALVMSSAHVEARGHLPNRGRHAVRPHASRYARHFLKQPGHVHRATRRRASHREQRLAHRRPAARSRTRLRMHRSAHRPVHRTGRRTGRRTRRRVVRMVKATGYCIGPCRKCQTRGRTYTGTRTLRGIAVARRSRRVAPLGSRLFIRGYGWARVDDVGGKVGSKQIDLRFRSHRRAQQWGSRWIKVVGYVPTSS